MRNPPALPVWPPGSTVPSSEPAQVGFPKPLLWCERGCENDLGNGIVQVCPQTSQSGWEIAVPSHSLVGFEEIHAASLSEKNQAFLLSRYLNYVAEYENSLKLAVHFQVASQIYFPHFAIFIPFGQCLLLGAGRAEV